MTCADIGRLFYRCHHRNHFPIVKMQDDLLQRPRLHRASQPDKHQMIAAWPQQRLAMCRNDKPTLQTPHFHHAILGDHRMNLRFGGKASIDADQCHILMTGIFNAGIAAGCRHRASGGTDFGLMHADHCVACGIVCAATDSITGDCRKRQ